jgi:hypothetical protein
VEDWNKEAPAFIILQRADTCRTAGGAARE